MRADSSDPPTDRTPGRPTRFERALEIAVIIAALLTIPIIVAEEYGAADDALVAVGDWVVWLIFLVHYVAMLVMSPGRLRHVRSSWFHLAIVILSFPMLPGMLATLRLTRLVRLLRFLRLSGVVWRASGSLRVVLGRGGLTHVAALSCGIVLGAGGVMAVLEPETVKGDYWGGVWWAIVTATTVGYGDISPSTPIGRILAVGLMLSGIGLTSTLAASVAAYFVGSDQRAETSALAERLDRIETLLERRVPSVDLPARRDDPE